MVRAIQSLQAQFAELFARPRWLFLLLGIVFFVGIVNRSFWAENEAYYSLGARSVLNGHWLLPVIYNDMVTDKPPLVFWAVASVSWFMGGVSEFSARFTNIIPALCALWFLFRFAATNVKDNTVAVLAVLMLATSREFFQIATEVNTDTFLVALLILAWSTIYQVMEHGFTWKRWAIIWIALATAMLAKGPVAPVLSGLLALAFGFVRYGLKEGWLRAWRLRPITGAIVCFLPFAVWSYAVYRTHGVEPLETILLKHNMQRFVQAFDHREAWWYYFAKLPIVMLPWSLLLPVLAWQWWNRKTSGSPVLAWETFSWCAVGVVFIFFSLSSSKRQYYLVPLMPWLSLLTANSVGVMASSASRWASLFRRIAIYGAPTALILLGIYFGIAYPLLDARRSPQQLVEQVERTVDEDDRLLIFAEEDPRLIYYLDEKFDYVGDLPHEVGKVPGFLEPNIETDVLLPRRALKVMKEVADVPLYVEGRGSYRNNTYYLLTTESGASRPEFTDAFIAAQSSRGKSRSATAK